jgi:hypothetical protein
MKRDRQCLHEFPCWYRVGSRCCCSHVEDIAACRGQEPSVFYVRLMMRNNQSLAQLDSASTSLASESLLPL